MPLFHKSLHPDINIDIAKYLHTVMKDPSEHSEKDKVGGANWIIDWSIFVRHKGFYTVIEVLSVYFWFRTATQQC